MDDNKRMVTPEEAEALLITDAKRIHTFRQGGPALLGADMDREDIIALFKEFPNAIEIGGPSSRTMKHPLVVIDETGPLFIEVDMEKLEIFDPLK